MKIIESSGKTVEEALSAGLKELGCDISEVTHEVIDRGSPGLFGMFGRLARVRITVKEEENDFDLGLPTMTLDSVSAEKKQKKNDKPKQEAKKAEPKAEPKAEAKEEVKEKAAPAEETVSEEPASEEAPAAPKKKRSRHKSNKKEAPKETEETAAEEIPAAPAAPVREFPELNVDALSENGKKAYEFISSVTKLMGVEVEIRMLEEEEQIFVDITGDTLGVLIGHRGDTLDALQYLTSLTVNKGKNDYTRVTLDVEHYRAKREETLRKLAIRMANRARKTGRRVVLEPMNPYERRVLHSALQDNPYVQTHSEGEEPYRRVIITLK